MKVIQRRVLEAGSRAQNFLDQHSEAIGSLGSARARLDAVVAEFIEFERLQLRATLTARGETDRQERLRRDIYQTYLRPIGLIAKMKCRGVSEYETLIVPSRVPRDGDFVPRVAAAYAAAIKHERLMTDSGLPRSYLPKLCQ
jgi:hypothetical protein